MIIFLLDHSFSFAKDQFISFDIQMFMSDEVWSKFLKNIDNILNLAFIHIIVFLFSEH